MKLQIECNHLKNKQQTCCICNQLFEINQARVILCNEDDKQCGDLCPRCIHQGFDWIKQHFEQQQQFQAMLQNRSRKIKLPA